MSVVIAFTIGKYIFVIREYPPLREYSMIDFV